MKQTHPSLCDVLVLAPRSPTARYRYSSERRAYVLDGVDAPAQWTIFDHAVVAETGADSRALPVLLLCRVPITRDVIVEARPIALVIHGTGESACRQVVAVASADPAFAQVEQVADLDQRWRDALLRALASPDGESCSWEGPAAAWQAINHARQQHRVAQAAQRRRQDAHPQWLTTVNPSLADVGRMPLLHSSDVEARMGTLPLRFRQYLAEYLAPQERVIAWVGRPEMRSARRRNLLRGVRLEQGVLIVTDAQLLFLEEVLKPDSGEIGFGFRVHTTALERLRSIGAARAGHAAVLTWRVTGQGGDEEISIEFPAELLDPLQRLIERLGGFFAWPAGSFPLRRIYGPAVIEPRLRDPSADDPDAPDPVADALARRLHALAEPDEAWIAQAFVPAWATEDQQSASLIALSRERLVRVDQSERVTSYPIASITSVALQYSVLESWLALHRPSNGGMERVVISFPYTGFGFVSLFVALRQLVANVPDVAESFVDAQP